MPAGKSDGKLGVFDASCHVSDTGKKLCNGVQTLEHQANVILTVLNFPAEFVRKC